MTESVLIAGRWREARAEQTFQAVNPNTGELLTAQYPISTLEDALEAIHAGWEAAQLLRQIAPETIARFLECYADKIETDRAHLVEIAHLETGYPSEPRLNLVELPRTTHQLRQAARAARECSWTRPIIDTNTNIRSVLAPLGAPVVVFGPNNFPFAFNSVAGGDFAAAIAARNPVIGKANTGHPGTTKRLAELALEAILETGLPASSVQLLYRTPNDVGFRLVSHEHIGATGFTGSKNAGLKLKAAADSAGKPFYAELSSVNPVFLLPGALGERFEALADEFFASCTMGSGQFCTNPGLLIVPADEVGESFVRAVAIRFSSQPGGVLLGPGAVTGLEDAVKTLTSHGAMLITGGKSLIGAGHRFANTVLTAPASAFLEHPEALQTEAFGPVCLIVLASNDEMLEIVSLLEGNLTGTVYSSTNGSDDVFYSSLEPVLRQKVGRLLNDKMPTGVAVSPAMNHGGPFPATGHPGFTAVGIPASITRFAALHCYDNVRASRLPPELRDDNPLAIWRTVNDQPLKTTIWELTHQKPSIQNY